MIWAYQDVRQWHPWYAWRPVDIGGFRCAWLEHVERRWRSGFLGYGSWEYALSDDHERKARPRTPWERAASAMSARSDETACGLSPKDASAVPKADAQKEHP